MKRSIFATLVLLFVALFSGGCEGGAETGDTPDSRGAFIPIEVDAAAADAVRKEDSSIVVLDIRTPEEFAAGHLPGAVNVDFRSDDFERSLSALEREKTYLVHCESGGRSGEAMEVFDRLGFRDILHLRSGFRDWKDSRFPVEQ